MAEFTDEIIRIIEKKDRTMETINNDLFQSLDPTQQTIFEAVKKHVSKMKTADGKIIFDDTNTEMVNEIDQVIANAIKRSKYPSSVQSYLSDWKIINEFNYTVHKDVNELSKSELEGLINPIQKQITEQTLTGLTGSGVNTNFIEPIRQGIFQNIVAGTSISDLEKYLTTYILGNPNVDGLFSRYVKQVSRDALNQYDGQVNAKIAEEFGLDAFRYVGSLIDDSRPQCRRWVNMRVIQKEDLAKELSWATNNGTGMIPGTNAENFAVYRGGYNCRHSAIPFKLTKSQREKLGIEAAKTDATQAAKIDDQIAEVTNSANQSVREQSKQSIDKLNPQIVATTAPESVQKAFFELIENQDGAAKIANERQTIIGLLDESQRSNPSANKNSALWASKPQLNPKQITKVALNSNGCCYTDNSALSVIFDNGQKIEGRNYSNECSNVSAIKYNGGKFWSMSSVSRAVDNNIAPTVTHEFAHLIHNKVDPTQYAFFRGDPKGHVKMIAVMKKLKMKKSDAPTTYGMSNLSEFWAESFTAYVYAPEWLIETHPKVHKLVETLLEEYQIDKTTITQYFRK
jgi:hypothetical protein